MYLPNDQFISFLSLLIALRVCEPLCSFTELDISITWAATLKATIFEFFQLHYTSVLEKVSVHIVHHHDEKHGHDFPIIGFPDIPDTPSPGIPGNPHPKPGQPIRPVPGSGASREIVLGETTVADYDFLQVISVEGILEHFKTLWQSYKDKPEDYAQLLIKWSYGEDITVSFDAIKLKFLSKDKAMIWINLANGSLKPLKGCVAYSFAREH